jgi:hypothetical protein
MPRHPARGGIPRNGGAFAAGAYRVRPKGGEGQDFSAIERRIFLFFGVTGPVFGGDAKMALLPTYEI